ncbi:MAG: Na+/H+ antiporter NhaA [Steroidobacteraceae bacterium]
MPVADSRRALATPIHAADDHVIGPPEARLSLVEYGSYACPHCRAANVEIGQLRERFSERLRYVFRHRPLEHNELARRAAELAECARSNEEFWRVHQLLMSRSATLTEADLRAVARELGLDVAEPGVAESRCRAAAAAVRDDERTAHASGVSSTPTFFINGVRYDGAWDHLSLSEALLGTLGHRVHSAAVGFGSWAPAAAVLLGLSTVIALLLSNSPVAGTFAGLWSQPLSIELSGRGWHLPLIEWINDGLLTMFFLVVGLEVKREFTVGRLARPRLACLPIAAAIGGLAFPALLYWLIVPAGPWQRGVGIPMPTDTAFAVAISVMLGPRVPVELRLFLTAASIVDDIGTIAVVAIFYSTGIKLQALLVAALLLGMLVLLNRSSVYRPGPYIAIGILLWPALHAAGLHATLAGVLLAMMIPTRPPPNLDALLAQAEAAISGETHGQWRALNQGPSLRLLRAVDSIRERVESPADRLLRLFEPWSSYLVLPLFALANAGLQLSAGLFAGRELMAGAIAVALVIGKPVGFLLASAAVIGLGLAERPKEYSWPHIVGAGALAGIGFTMSLFIAGRAFPDARDFAAAKAAVFGASLLSGVIGCVILTRAHQPGRGSGSKPAFRRRGCSPSAHSSR